jgi:hypothetical protein
VDEVTVVESLKTEEGEVVVAAGVDGGGDLGEVEVGLQTRVETAGFDAFGEIDGQVLGVDGFAVGERDGRRLLRRGLAEEDER